MKIFSYAENDDETLLTLSEVTVQADSTTLKKLAGFLIRCAEEIESDTDWEHEHFSDYISEQNLPVDLIVFRAESN